MYVIAKLLVIVKIKTMVKTKNKYETKTTTKTGPCMAQNKDKKYATLFLSLMLIFILKKAEQNRNQLRVNSDTWSNNLKPMNLS